MSADEQILDIATRLSREVALARSRLTAERENLESLLEIERKRLADELTLRRGWLASAESAVERESTRIRIALPDEHLGEEDVVLTLNVGGQLFTTRRSTLCAFDGSYLANLFSGRWEQSIERDSQGHFFLDFDPVSFRLVLNLLRNKRLQGPGAPMPPPCVPPEREEQFRNLVEYFGLTGELTDIAKASASTSLLAPLAPSAQTAGKTSSGGLLQSFFGGLVIGGSSASDAPQHQQEALCSGGVAAPRLAGARGLGYASRGPAASASEPSSSCSAGSAVPTGLQHANAAASLAGPSDAPTEASDSRQLTRRMPGWSRRVAHRLVQVDEKDPTRVFIGDTRVLAESASVRATRGFDAGVHAWKVSVELCSDWSYIGFVSDTWSALASPVGRAPQSWGVASNGMAYAGRKEVGKFKEFGSGSLLTFIANMDSMEVAVVVDGHEFPAIFTSVASRIFPAASNCRSPAEYTISFEVGGGTGVGASTDAINVAGGPHGSGACAAVDADQ